MNPRRLLAVLAVAMTLTSCSLQQDLQDGAVHEHNGVVSAAPAPELKGTGLHREPLDLASLRGGPVVIDYWGSWCGPCRAEQPELNRQYTEYAPRGIHYLGVDLRDNRDAALAYVSEFKVPYPSIFDDTEATAAGFNVLAPPTIIVIDARGQIRGRYLGTLAGLSKLLDSLLSER